MQLRSSRRLRAAIGAAVVLTLALTGCSGDETVTYTPPAQAEGELPGDTVAQLQAAVDQALEVSGTPGAVVGVWVPWSGTWVSATGTQGAAGDQKVTTDMSFRAATVTRQMTCDVLYGMADEKLIPLDGAVPDYVPGVADMEDVTLLDLCNGTAGIGSSKATVQPYLMNTPGRVWAPLQLASFGLGEKRSEVGVYRDSDAGYLMLGMALERASGKTASELIAEYVTQPLGLEATELPGDEAADPAPSPAMAGNYLPKLEGGYNCTAPVEATTMSASAGFTDSGVTTTIEELGRYVQAEARQALRPEGAKPARYAEPLPISDKSASWYQTTGGAYLVGSMIGQQGSILGYSTAAFSDPATGFTVAVSMNNSSSGSTATYLAWQLAAIASKAPAAEGQTVPEFGLPFTAEQYQAKIAETKTCVAPPAE